MEALEEHCAPAAVAVQEANYPRPFHRTRPMIAAVVSARGTCNFNAARVPSARRTGTTTPLPRSDRTFRSKLPLLKEVACDRRQHTRPFAGHVIACHESTENARRNNELSISAHAQQFTTERHAADPNGHHGP